MKAMHAFRKSVTRFLGAGQIGLPDSNTSQWRSNMRWLDRSGLALPVATLLESEVSSGFVPADVVKDMQLRLADNEKRMERMLQLFEEAVRALNGAGVRYCCAKGFSLIPDCFSHIRERHQVDIDFLIAPQDSQRAVNALTAVGYSLRDARSSGELRLSRPQRKHLGVNSWLYQLPEAPAIELHTRVWEPEADVIDFASLGDFYEQTESHEMSGVCFPRLSPSYQFVYLVLHIFRHFAGSWVRLLSIYEVATLLRTRKKDLDMWTEVSSIMTRERALASACALVISLARRTFGAEIPYPLRDVCVENLSAESALWLERYADAWLFTDPPGNKLALLAQQQFCRESIRWKQYVRQRLFPLRNLPSLHDDSDAAAAKTLSDRMDDIRYKVSRTWYHVRSDCEYLTARLEWSRLTHQAVDRV